MPRSWPPGLIASLPVVLPTAAVGASFGLLAAPVIGVVPTVVMSAVVWSGTAQFAALSVITAGAGVGLAAGSGLLANARFLPMGFAIAPSVSGSRVRRFATGALLADASFAIGHRGGGRFDPAALVWAAPLQYVAWLAGTTIGATGARLLTDPDRWGLDVLFPVFYLSLLIPEFARRAGRRPLLAAALAAAITVALTPIAPPGVPILAASAAALIGLRR